MQKYFKSRRNDAIADQISDETHTHDNYNSYKFICIHTYL